MMGNKGRVKYVAMGTKMVTFKQIRKPTGGQKLVRKKAKLKKNELTKNEEVIEEVIEKKGIGFVNGPAHNTGDPVARR